MTMSASQIYGSASSAAASASQWIASTASSTAQSVSAGVAVAKAHLSAACFKIALFAAAAFERISTAYAYGWAQTKGAMVAGYDHAAYAASVGWTHTKAAAIAGYTQASVLAKAGFAFVQAHPVQVGLGISALVLTAALAVAYDRSRRAETV